MIYVCFQSHLRTNFTIKKDHQDRFVMELQIHIYDTLKMSLQNQTCKIQNQITASVYSAHAQSNMPKYAKTQMN